MKEYAHIDTIWKRTPDGRLLEGDYAQEEFAYLANNAWVGTEKVDGTNVRVMLQDTAIRFGGKTVNAQMPSFLLRRLEALFEPLADRLHEQFPDGACLYGEGYGAKIQKGGGNYKVDGVDFVLFDVLVGDWWLQREALEEIATTFALSIVPIVFRGTLPEACDKARLGFRSTWGDFSAEGLVLHPAVPLRRRNGARVITKIKHRDYR